MCNASSKLTLTCDLCGGGTDGENRSTLRGLTLCHDCNSGLSAGSGKYSCPGIQSELASMRVGGMLIDRKPLSASMRQFFAGFPRESYDHTAAAARAGKQASKRPTAKPATTIAAAPASQPAPLASRLAAIQSKLTRGCHVKVEHDDLDRGWNATIKTERNEYPHWITFHGDSPEAAIAELEQYFAGNRKDHARMQRDPSAFLAAQTAPTPAAPARKPPRSKAARRNPPAIASQPVQQVAQPWSTDWRQNAPAVIAAIHV